MKPCSCKPVLYLDGTTVRVLRIDHCRHHAQVDDLLKALAHALDTIERLTQGAPTRPRVE
jgi:acyl transferase domain-containing protein